ncbi:hypothetical protein [Paenibacillus sp. JCM 10914]|nr:hypothetical protein [Paenibacillus sp. JCM 10914]
MQLHVQQQKSLQSKLRRPYANMKPIKRLSPYRQAGDFSRWYIPYL